MTALQTPAPDAPASEWGRFAVSIPGFPCNTVLLRRGMVGWLYGESADVDWPLDGLRAMFVGEKGATTLYQVVVPGGYPQHRMRNGRHEFIPDPDHPATEGWLLRLIGAGVFSLWMAENWRVGDDERIGCACIAAAAALGRWPGGGA